MTTLRVLVTGSRTWTDYATIHNRLAGLRYGHNKGPMVVVHGACPRGADQIASEWVQALRHPDVTEERHPADWSGLGKPAGYVRNAEMVALGADLVLAFIHDGSRGATHCAGLAEKAGIQTLRFETRTR